MPAETRERAALIALLRSGDVKWPRVACEVLERGSAAALLEQAVGDPDTLFARPEFTDDLIGAAAGLLREWEASGLGVHTVMDESYPHQLREIRELPPVVFTRGHLADDTRAVAVVGSRKASEEGLHAAAQTAEVLAHSGVTVVSGLAAGIDTAAHQAALAARGRTVAVLGNGIRQCYPAANRRLQERIAVEGLVLSQFWPDAPPRRPQFLMRNAVMSGYAAATLVVEAGEHSGARNQARLALQHGRPVVLRHGLLEDEWARTLAQLPGVTVVRELDELVEVVNQILEQRAAELSPWDGGADLAVA